MNNPEDIAVDVTAERAWLKEHKESNSLSWGGVSQRCGVPQGTLSAWIYGNYQGNSEKVGQKIFRYRQMVESQAEQAAASPGTATGKALGYVDMPTARRLKSLMIVAQSGEMTVGATGPGTGKTMVSADYAACVSNVWTVSISPVTKSLAAMTSEVLRAVGGKVGSGWVRQMAAQVSDMVANRNGLLLIDEANHLEFEALEQLRAWHDTTRVGICLLGNEELIGTIRSGNQRHGRHAFARLNSRIAMSHVQDLPLPEDIDAYLDAWGIENGEQRAFLKRIGLTPGAGGLREIRQIISNATMLATEDGVQLSHAYLREALSMRSTRLLRQPG